MEGVNKDTVWTWNAIGKRAGAWTLDADAPEARKGFLLNHLISELLPRIAHAFQFRSRHRAGGLVRPARTSGEMRSRAMRCTEPQFADAAAAAGIAPAPRISTYGAQFEPREAAP